MARAKRKTKVEFNQEIVNLYMESGEPWPAGKKEIAAWAIRKKLWTPQRNTAIDLCADELAEAMRAEMERDPQGRTVRAKHCAKIAV